MKNKFKNFIFILFSFIFLFKNLYANEPFVFDITEVEILENGNKINGYKGGTATSEDGSTITGKNFFYNKLTNILEVTGDVRYLDVSNDIVITSDSAIYFKNDEKFFTTGNSKAINENNTITASSLQYDKINNIFKAKKNAIATDLKKTQLFMQMKFLILKMKKKFTQQEIQKRLMRIILLQLQVSNTIK